jgi:hypothetical protein
MDQRPEEWPFDPSVTNIPAQAVAAVPAELAREENVMPVALADGVLTIAVDRPGDFELIDRLRFVLARCQIRRIDAVPAASNAIRAAIARYYDRDPSS